MKINLNIRIIKPITFLLVILLTSIGFAQPSKVFDKKWELAKGHFSDGNFDMALMLFKPLTIEKPENKYAEYANYYTALCLFKQNKLKESRQYLLQIQNKYPLWEGVVEAKYLHANIEFINQNYDRALELLDSTRSDDISSLKLHYLSKIPSTALLKGLLLKHPNDREVAQVYCYKLSKQQPLFNYDIKEIDSLSQHFKIKSKKLKNTVELNTKDQFKDTFHIAVLYPFNIYQLEDYNSKRRHQFVIDHYKGLSMAADTLAAQGIYIKIHAYDTKNDTDDVKKVLQHPELKLMDVIIGPVFSKNIPFVSKFVHENQIICINPFSNYASTIIDSGFVYMHSPTFSSIGKSAAEFIINSDSFPNKKILLLTFSTKKDTLIANAFIDRLMKDSISSVKSVIIDPGEDVLRALNRVKDKSIEVIFAPSTNTTIGTNLISWLIMKELNIPSIGNASWLESREYNITKANEFTTYFYDMKYINSAVDTTLSFDKKYLKSCNIPVSSSSLLGYELGHYLGHNLSKHGKYFHQSLWNMKPQKGYMYPVYDYKQSYYNNFVPIFRLKDYQLTPVNFQLESSKKEISDEQSQE